MLPDAEVLFNNLAEQMRPQIDPASAVSVGIHTGGFWVAERLAVVLQLKAAPGSIDVSFYRDDYAKRGLHANANSKKVSHIPFDVENADVIVVDDVLHTGRTLRAAINELFDYGRPRRVALAVLVDRGGRELPFAPTYCALTQDIAGHQRLDLERSDAGILSFRVIDR